MSRSDSHAKSGNLGPRSISSKPSPANVDCSDDEVSPCSHKEEGLECPICWESFNIVENVPYVLWCGHTLCKNCVLGLKWAIMKFPSAPVQLPLFISCPWCNLLSFRLIYKGDLKFPRKNYFLLWMVERLNSGQGNFFSSLTADNQRVCPPNGGLAVGSNGSHHHSLRRIPQYMHPDDSPSSTNQPGMRANYLNLERIHSLLRESLVFFVHLIAKFPLVLIFLLIVLYAIPASAAILALYILVTILFALPSFLILYFAYPSLDWLAREIIS